MKAKFFAVIVALFALAIFATTTSNVFAQPKKDCENGNCN
jgi:hypothetical protein